MDDDVEVDVGADDFIEDEADIAGSANEIRDTPDKKEPLVVAKRWVVFAKDLPNLLKEISRRRNIPWYQQMAMKIGIDGGQGFLKVALCLYEDIGNDDFDIRPQKSPVKKKGKLKQFSELGQKKLIILFMGEKIPETHANVLKILEMLKIKTDGSIAGTFASDLKLVNILIGIQGYSCTHACPYCNIKTRGQEAYIGPFIHRTFGRCKTKYQEFIAPPTGRKKKHHAKDFENCVHPPIIQADENLLIMELLTPPSLHLFLGLGNRIFDQLQEETIELKNSRTMSMTAYQWAHASPRCIVKEQYYGKKLNGPNLNKLLQNAEALTAFLPESLKKFGEALQKLDRMKKSCFSLDLHPDWEIHHKDFIEGFLELGIPRFPKFHITEVHVPEIIKIKQTGLGRFTEAPFESVHKEFKNEWSRYKRHKGSTSYPWKLKDAVVAHNSMRL